MQKNKPIEVKSFFINSNALSQAIFLVSKFLEGVLIPYLTFLQQIHISRTLPILVI